MEREERATGFEPVTSSLGSWHSTPELRPQGYGYITYTIELAVYNRGAKTPRVQRRQPVPQLSDVLLDAVLHDVGALAHLAAGRYRL